MSVLCQIIGVIRMHNFFVHGKKYKQSEGSLFAVCFIITAKIERNFQNKIGTEMKNKVLFT